MGQVVRLVTKRQRVTREVAELGRDAILGLPDDRVPAWARSEMLNALHRIAEPARDQGSWPGGYVMLSLLQIATVWDAIRALPSKHRPGLVRHAFDLVLVNLIPSEGRVALTREEFAKRMGCSMNVASEVMGTLAKLGVIERRRVRIDGVRGPGAVQYFINPHVGWNGRLDVREAEAKERKPPLLRLMEGPRA